MNREHYKGRNLVHMYDQGAADFEAGVEAKHFQGEHTPEAWAYYDGYYNTRDEALIDHQADRYNYLNEK